MSKTQWLAVVSQVAVMAGIVATLVYFPLGVALALTFAGACGYAAWMFPWEEQAKL